MDQDPQQRELRDGLVLRWARPEDVERQVALTALAFRQGPDGPPNPEPAPWARDLAGGAHPLSSADRLAIVEDPANGLVVACVWLIPMTWSFGGIEISVGRPEHVATHPDYRRRGLIGELFTAIHARSTRDGDIAQAITGIPWFYRQFGYEYALELGGGTRIDVGQLPPTSSGQATGIAFREARSDELEYARRAWQESHRGDLVRNAYPARYWRWLHHGIDEGTGMGWRTLVMADADDRPCGALSLCSRRWGRTVEVHGLTVDEPWSLYAATRPALRAIQEVAATMPAMPFANTPAFGSIAFRVGSGHPIHTLLRTQYGGRPEQESAWLLRVPDLPRFLEAVAPVIEQRFAGSPMRTYSGSLFLDFYRTGMTIAFERGRLAGFGEGRPESELPAASAGFPPGVFLQLLFGRRTLAELRHILPDVWATPEAEVLLDILFPRRPSHVVPVA
jgi:GNAT superfamily N-acetyltransferase